MHTRIKLEVWLAENEFVAHVRWYFMQFFVCPLRVIHRFTLILIGVTDAKNKMYLKQKGVNDGIY